MSAPLKHVSEVSYARKAFACSHELLEYRMRQHGLVLRSVEEHETLVKSSQSYADDLDRARKHIRSLEIVNADLHSQVKTANAKLNESCEKVVGLNVEVQILHQVLDSLGVNVSVTINPEEGPQPDPNFPVQEGRQGTPSADPVNGCSDLPKTATERETERPLTASEMGLVCACRTTRP